MRPKRITVGVLTNDLNGICLDQTTAGADDLLLNGVLVTSGVASAAYAQKVSLEAAANNAGVVFTITGTDSDGKTVSEDMDGPNINTVYSTGYFKTVTGIAVDGAVDGNVECGWMAVGGMATASYPLNAHQVPFAVTLDFNLTAGTMTVHAEYTVDDPEKTDWDQSLQVNGNWPDVAGMSGMIEDTSGNIAFPVMAVRFIQLVGSTTGTCKLTIIQGDAR